MQFLDSHGCEDYVYHYTSAQTAIEGVFVNGNLRFSSLSAMHDPREASSVQLIFLGDFDPKMPPDSRSADFQHEFRYLRQEAVKIACFCTDKKNGVDGQEYPFNRGFCRSRMWSQYAKGHTGVCIVFSRRKLEKNLRIELRRKMDSNGGQLWGQQLRYENPLKHNAFPVINTDQLSPPNQYLAKEREQFLFTKVKNYRDESEYRIVLFHSKLKGHSYIDMLFHDSLVAVVLGDRFPDCYRLNFEDIARRFKVPVYQMNMSHGHPTIVPSTFSR